MSWKDIFTKKKIGKITRKSQGKEEPVTHGKGSERAQAYKRALDKGERRKGGLHVTSQEDIDEMNKASIEARKKAIRSKQKRR